MDRLRPLQSVSTENAGLEKCGASWRRRHWIPQWCARRFDGTRRDSSDLVVRVARLAPRRTSLGIATDRCRNLRPVVTRLGRDGADYARNQPVVFDRPAGAGCRNSAWLVALRQTE